VPIFKRPVRLGVAAIPAYALGEEPEPGPEYLNRVILVGGQLRYCDGLEWINTAGGTGVGLTTKGDLLTHDGLDTARLPVGSDGDVLTADSAQTLGVKWAAGGGSGGLTMKKMLVKQALRCA